MLILSRKLNESIVIDGRIIVKVLRIDKDTVKLGIQAPPELPVHRQEIYEAIQKNKEGSHAVGQKSPFKAAVPQTTPPSEDPGLTGSTPEKE